MTNDLDILESITFFCDRCGVYRCDKDHNIEKYINTTNNPRSIIAYKFRNGFDYMGTKVVWYHPASINKKESLRWKA